MDRDADLSRRNFIRAAAGTTTAAAASGAAGTALAQNAPYGGWLSDANGFGGTTADYGDQQEVTVKVGAGSGLAFALPAIKVAPGTTVTWEWTGQGGAHNVVAQDGTFDSGSTVATKGHTFSYTFEKNGLHKYYCSPHKPVGMKGVVAVGDTAQGTVAPASEVSLATGGTPTATGTTSGNGGGGGGGGQPDWGGWLSDANAYGGSVVDKRGQKQVTVKVGAGSQGLAFQPAAVHIDTGATIKWEWTGRGGSHNVVAQGGAFDSGAPQASGTFTHTFDTSGLYKYYCAPHQSLGMKGGVVVGSDYPTVQTGGNAGPSTLPSGATALGVGATFVTVSTLGLAYFFLKYGGDYGEFEE